MKGLSPRHTDYRHAEGRELLGEMARLLLQTRKMPKMEVKEMFPSIALTA